MRSDGSADVRAGTHPGGAATRGLEPAITIDNRAVAPRHNRNPESEFPDRCAHPLDNVVVAARIARVFDRPMLEGRGCSSVAIEEGGNRTVPVTAESPVRAKTRARQ
jgi:hypothetical protein